VGGARVRRSTLEHHANAKHKVELKKPGYREEKGGGLVSGPPKLTKTEGLLEKDSENGKKEEDRLSHRSLSERKRATPKNLRSKA